MTKAEILSIASNVQLMDQLNTISGLLEVNNGNVNELISNYINDFYAKINSVQIENKSHKTKSYMLAEIAKIKGQEYADSIAGKRLLAIRVDYIDLIKGKK